MYEIEILLIDDNPDDIQLTQETFNQNKLKNNLSIVSTAADALAFLRHEVYISLPDLILLDSAFHQNAQQGIFEAIKQDVQLREVPLVMLSAAGSKPDLLAMYDHKTPPNGFVTKPFDFIQFINVIKTIKSFKVAIVTSL